MSKELSDGFDSVTAYVNAGGRGTRLNNTFTPDPEYGIAKGLLEVGSPPIKLVDHHINRLSSAMFRNIVIGAGDLLLVKEYVDGRYRNNKMISSVETSTYQQLGTAGDLIVACRTNPDLFGEHILINNVDTILELDMNRFTRTHLARRAVVSIALTTQDGVPNQDAFLVDSSGKVLFSKESGANIRSEEDAEKIVSYRGSSTGALMINTDFLRNMQWSPVDGQLSLYRDVMSSGLAVDGVGAYHNGNNFFVDVGTDLTWKRYSRSSELQDQLCYDENNTYDRFEETVS